MKVNIRQSEQNDAGPVRRAGPHNPATQPNVQNQIKFQDFNQLENLISFKCTGLFGILDISKCKKLETIRLYDIPQKTRNYLFNITYKNANNETFGDFHPNFSPNLKHFYYSLALPKNCSRNGYPGWVKFTDDYLEKCKSGLEKHQEILKNQENQTTSSNQTPPPPAASIPTIDETTTTTTSINPTTTTVPTQQASQPNLKTNSPSNYYYYLIILITVILAIALSTYSTKDRN